MINKDIFEHEISICKQLYTKQGGCKWGNCEQCGVVLLLHKLNTGEVIEDKNKIREIKNFYLKDTKS